MIVLLASALKLLDVATVTVAIVLGAAIVAALAGSLIARSRRRAAAAQPVDAEASAAPATPEPREAQTATSH